MARIKRWFHVSHDINADEEVWELTDLYGVWGLRVWLQILSIADRNDGVVKGNLDQLSKSMSRLWGSNSKRYSTGWRLNKARMMIEWMSDKRWISIESDSISVRNWLIYNPRREHDSSPPNLPILSEPSYPYKISSAEPAVDRFTERKWENLDENIKAVADRIYASNPERFKKLITWIKQAQKFHYSDPIITEALLRFEPRAGEAARWYPYLDRIIDKVRADYDKRQSDHEHESRKQGERELANSLKLNRVVKDA